MIYLIGQLALYLFVAFLFAAFAGWSFAAQRAAPNEAKRRRDRETLLRDIERAAAGGAVSAPLLADRESDAARGLLAVRDGRIAELESALERARARADEAAAELAEFQRRERAVETDATELSHLRALVAVHDEERANEVEAEVEEVGPSETEILQSWRLRYFEQRVKYLEGQHHAPAALAAPAEASLEWRLREAEARAAHLADEVRALSARAPTEEPRALAADSDADMLLRWRMLYLERRAAYLQEQVATAPLPAPAADPDMWKWRARYLEARVRHLESRPAPAVAASIVQAASASVEAAPLAAVEAPPEPPPAPSVPAQKPPILAAARNGAPDDFTLIETISPMQQTMLNAIGVFHFDQIAAWSPANVAWVDRYFRLRGRVAEEEWVEQAVDLAREGVHASRRMLASEEA